MSISDIKQAEKVLQTYVANASAYSGDGMSLDRMWPLLQAVGNPHKRLKVIHIAGTSGKTSTAYYCGAILHASGQKVGLTVSPHVDSITERIQINGKTLTEKEFCRDLGDFLELVKDVVVMPSYFEILIVFVLWEFVRNNVDYAVLETGMGGLLDSTNVVSIENKVCVITDIGLDHTHILGSTLAEIAAQKAGIIHAGNKVFTYYQGSKVTPVIEKQVKKVGATLNIVPPPNKYLIATKSQKEPKFQIRNYNLAKAICDFVAERDKFKIIYVELSDVTIPGRMETTILEDGTTLIMDGAHNGQKIETFVDSFRSIYPGQKAGILLALKSGKDYPEVIDGLSAIVDSIILTTFNASQDLPVKSQDPEVLLKYCKKKGLDAAIISDAALARVKLVKNKSQIKIIIGSFYLLGQVRRHL